MPEEDFESNSPDRHLANGQGGPGRGPGSGGPPDFQPGAIVRVAVENFVTYDRAEFLPGPSLNMVIGPNGTGKSSLVCAICLGLGYPPNVLGRASSIGEFVKHGKDQAIIEVELKKRPEDNRNITVRVRITREDNSRKFWVNRKESTLKLVQQRTQSLRIQIDNLCQFLPQDKVAEFAGLNSVDLLTKTLQAAAPEDMIEDQETLRELFRQQKGVRAQLAADTERLSRLEMRQETLQADVEKIRLREKIKAILEELRMVRVLVVYHDARRAYTTAKKNKREGQEKLTRLEESSAPALEAVNRKKEYLESVDRVFQARQKSLRAAERTADNLLGEIERVDASIQDLSNKGDAVIGSLGTIRTELGKIRRKITDLEAGYKQTPREFNATEWNTKIREQEHLLRDHHSDRRGIAEKIQAIKTTGNAKQMEFKRFKKDLDELESQQGQMLTRLKKMNPDAARAWDWVQENRDKFEQEVFGPPMLSCSVKDERLTDLVQSVLQADDFFCFTTQTREDHKTLSNQLYKEMSLSVTIRTCLTPLDSFKPPIAREDMAALGLDGYIVDYLEGPAPVLAMLCAEKRLHASGVALKEISEEQYDRIVKGEVINQFAAGRQSYRISRRREYGPTAVSTRVRQVERGRFWTDQPVDAGEKAELSRKMDELKADLDPLKADLAQLQEKDHEIEQAYEDTKDKINELRQQKSELQMEFNKWQSLPEKIEMEKKALAEKREELEQTKERVLALETQNDAAALAKAKFVLNHKEAISLIRTRHLSLLDAQIRLIEAKSDVKTLEAKNAEIHQSLEQEKRTLQELEKNMDTLKARAQKALEAAEAIPDESWDKSRLLEMGRGKTAEDIDSDISAETIRLDVIEAGNPDALDEYDKRATDIERLKRDKSRREKNFGKLSSEIEALRSSWEPRLDELISQINAAFSHNFEQISCAGEIGVHKDEDFDKWAVEIKVKFRENESLQKLDQHRQSGGERAVSTIFYLMSLQSMAQAPFRVVDEINQGMDPRNERMVHERMVEIACREHSSQYFLITPKLLPGLKYDERMRILCIASGEHMPIDSIKLNLARCAQIQRNAVAAGAA